MAPHLIDAHCKVCEDRTTFLLIGMQEDGFGGCYAMYRCFRCRNSVLFRKKELEKILSQRICREIL